MESSGGLVPDPSPAGGALSVTLELVLYMQVQTHVHLHELLAESSLVNLLSVSTLNAMFIILYNSYIS